MGGIGSLRDLVPCLLDGHSRIHRFKHAWAEGFKGGRFIDRGRLNRQMKATAQKLRNAGLVTSDSARFTSHALRACFETEAVREEVGMRESIMKFLMGHTNGVSGIYDNTAEVRPEAIYRAYMRLEPYLSFYSQPSGVGRI